MILLIPSKPRDANKVVMKTLVRKVVFCSWLIVPAGVKSIPEKENEENSEDFLLSKSIFTSTFTVNDIVPTATAVHCLNEACLRVVK